eukprot:15087736-Alexandrium_andersonii.AAC.1
MGPFAGDEYAPQSLSSPWPVANAADACGWAPRRRVSRWAQAQAWWLGQQALSDRSRGVATIAVATLWVAAARSQ